mmetsp:Transcript_4828/g.9899  ORF Transcript_4828/g.9899 Transcript_4828/m.9899 type:complete len:186 (+) Transcript_4828:290-847(+)
MAFDIKYLPLSSIATMAAAFVYCIYLAINHPETSTGPAQSLNDYTPVIYVVAASMCMYYVFLFYQSYTTFDELQKARKTFRDKKTKEAPDIKQIKYGVENVNVVAANRTAGNYTEQLVPFLLGLYFYSTYVSVQGAVKWGWVWLFFRSFYTVVFKLPFPCLLISTIPAYYCVWFMMGATLVTISK